MTNNTRGINTEAWDSHKLQVAVLSYNWWRFQARYTVQGSTDNNSTDKVKTSLEWKEYFSHFQDTTDMLPFHIHLPVCFWLMDPPSRAPKKNTSHGNEVLQQDTTNFIQRPCSSVPRSSRQSDHTKTSWSSYRDANRSCVDMSLVHLVWSKPSCKTQWKGEEEKADKGRGEKTTSGNGQAWSLPSPGGQWITGRKYRKLAAKSSVEPQRPSR